MTALELKHIMEMPLEQKILLIEDVWDSVRSEARQIPVPDSQLQELNRRYEKYQGKPDLLLNEQQLRDALKHSE